MPIPLLASTLSPFVSGLTRLSSVYLCEDKTKSFGLHNGRLFSLLELFVAYGAHDMSDPRMSSCRLPHGAGTPDFAAVAAVPLKFYRV